MQIVIVISFIYIDIRILALIINQLKNKKQCLFKTSPKQAASLIVEEVVQNPTKYEDCINYLGDLYTGESSSIGVNNDKDLTNEVTSSSDSSEKTPKGKYVDRYSYQFY